MKETLERVEKANEDKMSKILGINTNLVKKLERVEKVNKDKMSKIFGINANLVQKLERVVKSKWRHFKDWDGIGQTWCGKVLHWNR